MDRGLRLRDGLPGDRGLSPVRTTPVDEVPGDGQDGDTMRVLIVDDHPSFRSIARRILTGGGFTVVGEAADGAAAVRAAIALRPDVILLDVQLPDTDGFVLAEALATWAEPPAVVLMSSRSSADYGRRVDRSPAAGFVPKADLSGAAVRRLLR